VGIYKSGNEDALCGFLGLYGGEETLLLGTVYCGDRQISRGMWAGKEGEEPSYQYVEYEGELDFPPDKGAGNFVKPLKWLKNLLKK